MPHIEIQCYPGRTEDVKQKCADKITEVITETLGCDVSKVSVVIKEIPPEEWKEKVWDVDIAPNEKHMYKKPGYTCE
jgi:4-oxalocrotonate tautomerase